VRAVILASTEGGTGLHVLPPNPTRAKGGGCGEGRGGVSHPSQGSGPATLTTGRRPIVSQEEVFHHLTVDRIFVLFHWRGHGEPGTVWIPSSFRWKALL
jgi:hypothetical protein